VGQLNGKRAIITGASSGMGRATALLFAREGADLALMSRREDDLRAVASEVEALGRRAIVLAVDLTERVAVTTAADLALSELGGFDVAIHAAGTNLPRRALTVLDPADWDMMVQTNLTAAYNLTQAILRPMRDGGGGLIVYVSSAAVQRPDVSGVAYQATKHGLVGLAHGAMQEEKGNGIRTTVLFPGLTDTPLVLKRPTPTPPEVIAKALQPEDVAAACLFVAALPSRVHVPELMMVPAGL
jgi:NADP-dependent 3-hydroxy acid dehydrogenase YdfG